MLEIDYELAKAYLDSFTEVVETLTFSADPNQLAGSVEHLLLACHILGGNLQKEEQLVYPMSEQILTDLDYFFS